MFKINDNLYVKDISKVDATFYNWNDDTQTLELFVLLGTQRIRIFRYKDKDYKTLAVEAQKDMESILKNLNSKTVQKKVEDIIND